MKVEEEANAFLSRDLDSETLEAAGKVFATYAKEVKLLRAELDQCKQERDDARKMLVQTEVEILQRDQKLSQCKAELDKAKEGPQLFREANSDGQWSDWKMNVGPNLCAHDYRQCMSIQEFARQFSQMQRERHALRTVIYHSWTHGGGICFCERCKAVANHAIALQGETPL